MQRIAARRGIQPLSAILRCPFHTSGRLPSQVSPPRSSAASLRAWQISLKRPWAFALSVCGPRFMTTEAARVPETSQGTQDALDRTEEGIVASLSVSDAAAKQLHAINRKANTNNMLRITVESGGCHGFQYKMELTTQMEDDDVVFENDGAKVVVDTISLDLINGSTLDYVEELIGSSFQVVNNPKAESSCGCKTSFNVKL
ncbi:iron-sulfur cluster assembly accessory protein [Spizellomyces punctatus DAOM BR117]|uniref:Iron-sulfur cluster assembly accessory protein n=1 Tax=Spizellomyces punctatus (strain DAOM BR117) TaxID=645134 RepID=A0A0L0HJ37_SPIPD|nr:iron-sulfur cluster assembly accessory protein [Spizellomyces punctatus DAOM BR117]KND01043.1 iron-sulfur cluster assembly accessory protein [Spizellomyces punctatus DAOM BR117]|eukprot:XP_016609082.1 iron-sulfur cluster assembly accessory protein [Spizellomyces punctatus DAOM BR117]